MHSSVAFLSTVYWHQDDRCRYLRFACKSYAIVDIVPKCQQNKRATNINAQITEDRWMCWATTRATLNTCKSIFCCSFVLRLGRAGGCKPHSSIIITIWLKRHISRSASSTGTGQVSNIRRHSKRSTRNQNLFYFSRFVSMRQSWVKLKMIDLNSNRTFNPTPDKLKVIPNTICWAIWTWCYFWSGVEHEWNWNQLNTRETMQVGEK